MRINIFSKCLFNFNELIISLCSYMQNPQFDKPIMFNALPVREWNMSISFFYIKMVQDYPIQIKAINKLGQK